MRKLRLALSLAALLLCAPLSRISAALVGTSVTGSLQFGGGSLNVFDPSFGFVPGGYLNSAGTTVTIAGSATEFGFDDFANLVTANFSDNQLVVSDAVEASGPNFPFTMSFTDLLFTGMTVSTVSDNFPLTYSLSSDVLTVDWAGAGVTAGQTFAATITVAPAPEPFTFGLLLFSGLALACFRRRLLRQAAGS